MFNFLFSILCVCVSMRSDAVLSSNGYPLPHGWFLQRGEGQFREVQTLCSQAMSSASYRARQGLFSFCSYLPFPLFQSVLSNSVLVQVRVGLIQFGSTPRLEFALDSYTTKQELKKHIKNISYRCASPLFSSQSSIVLGFKRLLQCDYSWVVGW